MIHKDYSEIEYEGEFMGIEPEDTGGNITRPYDANLIRIEPKYLTIGQLADRIEHNELDLSPDFQRKFVWKEKAQSRLIESMFLRIPLPAFYMDATDDDKWLVVDGSQRLNTVKRFLLDKELRLCELEFLKEYNGKLFDELPRNLQRRIKETQVTLYLIQKGTPPDVKFNIFRRINTGGLPLSPQEIRHALNQGEATKLLAKLAQSVPFQNITGGKDERMEGQEMILRFFAFTLISYNDYTDSEDFDEFLRQMMQKLNKLSEDERKKLEQRFLKAMKAAYDILGKDAFRKKYTHNQRRLYPINKALFEAWAVNLGQLNERQIELIVHEREKVIDKFIELMNDREFDSAISQGTGVTKKVRYRFSGIEKLIKEVCYD